MIEFLKKLIHRNLDPDIYFWRDSNQNEVDLLFSNGTDLAAIEIKSGRTIASDFFKGLNYWKNLHKKSKRILIYGGDDTYVENDHHILSWSQI